MQLEKAIFMQVLMKFSSVSGTVWAVTLAHASPPSFKPSIMYSNLRTIKNERLKSPEFKIMARLMTSIKYLFREIAATL
jgi:hypothetical protein